MRLSSRAHFDCRYLVCILSDAPLGPDIGQLLMEFEPQVMFPAIPLTLPWEDSMRGSPVTVPLVFTTPRGNAINRATFNDKACHSAVWRGARAEPSDGCVRPKAFPRLGPAGPRGEHQGRRGVPRAHRFRVQAAGLPLSHAPSDRRARRTFDDLLTARAAFTARIRRGRLVVYSVVPMQNSVTPAIIAAVAALAAAGFGVLGAVVGARLHKSREHQHWLRDQRLRVSVDFITATRRLLNEYRRHGEAGMDAVERGELRGKMRSARSAIELLCSPETVAAAKLVNDSLYTTGPKESAEQKEATEDAFRQAVSALRAEVNLEAPPG